MKYGTNYSWKCLRTTDVKKILGVINFPLSFHLIRNHLIQSPWLKQKLMIQIINQNLYSFIDIKILDLELISNHAKDIIKLMIIMVPAKFGLDPDFYGLQRASDTKSMKTKKEGF